MRQVRLRVGCFLWRTGMRFCTRNCPAARRIFRQVAHLGATDGRLRHRAPAVATTGGRLMQFGGSVCPGCKRQQTRSQAEIKYYPESDATETPERWGSHEESLHPSEQKTDSACLLKAGGTPVLMVLEQGASRNKPCGRNEAGRAQRRAKMPR